MVPVVWLHKTKMKRELQREYFNHAESKERAKR